jgi:hypothetical protein
MRPGCAWAGSRRAESEPPAYAEHVLAHHLAYNPPSPTEWVFYERAV